MKRATCLNNLAQLGKGVAMYADDYDQILFPAANRFVALRNVAAVQEWPAFRSNRNSCD
jgi:hypothetical protein